MADVAFSTVQYNEHYRLVIDTTIYNFVRVPDRAGDHWEDRERGTERATLNMMIVDALEAHDLDPNNWQVFDRLIWNQTVGIDEDLSDDDE